MDERADEMYYTLPLPLLPAFTLLQPTVPPAIPNAIPTHTGTQEMRHWQAMQEVCMQR